MVACRDRMQGTRTIPTKRMLPRIFQRWDICKPRPSQPRQRGTGILRTYCESIHILSTSTQVPVEGTGFSRHQAWTGGLATSAMTKDSTSLVTWTRHKHTYAKRVFDIVLRKVAKKKHRCTQWGLSACKTTVACSYVKKTRSGTSRSKCLRLPI